MKIITFRSGWLFMLLALAWGGCASTPVREYEENTKRVISEEPATPGR